MPHTTVPGTGSTPVDPGYAAHNAPDYMPDGADVAGPFHHDFNADGGDYGTDYGVHDATGDYTGGNVGFAGGDIPLAQGDASHLDQAMSYLKHDFLPQWGRNYIVQSSVNATIITIDKLQKKLIQGEKVSVKEYLNDLIFGTTLQAGFQSLASTTLQEVAQKTGFCQGGQQQMDRMKKLDVLYTERGFNNFFDETMLNVKNGNLFWDKAKLEVGSTALVTVTGLVANLFFKPQLNIESIEKGQEIVKNHKKYLSMLDSIGISSADKKKIELIKRNLSKAVSSMDNKKIKELSNQYKNLFEKVVRQAPE